MMAHLLQALENGEDVGDYGRLTFRLWSNKEDGQDRIFLAIFFISGSD
jgi:hypothetical protein